MVTISYMRRNPIKIIGMLVSLHSFVYGLGYILGTDGFSQTVLYGSVSEIVNPLLFGWIMLISGIFLALGFIREKESLVSYGSTIQSFIWLFAAFVYFLQGYFFLGIGVGLIWTLLAGYTGFAFKNREATITELVNERLGKYL